MQKYPFTLSLDFSFICSKIFYKDFLRSTVSIGFSQRYLKICIKNPLLWEWHFTFFRLSTRFGIQVFLR